MSGFKTHLGAGIMLGSAAGLWGWQQGIFAPDDLVAVVSIAAVAGLTPDLDADQGRPLNLLFDVLAVLFPALLLPKLHPILPGPSSLLALAVLSFLAIRYGLLHLVQKITVHRGNLHSVPFALIIGEAVWLLFSQGHPQPPALHNVPFVFALVAALSALLHLLLDEMASVGTRWGFVPRLKRSAGSALKFGGGDRKGTILLYSVLLGGAALLWALTTTSL